MPFQPAAAVSISASTVARSGVAADTGPKKPKATAKTATACLPQRQLRDDETERGMPFSPLAGALLARGFREDQISLDIPSVVGSGLGGDNT